ncbi:MAG: hypothetical protein U5M51_11650 [Emticicia sp.]|nr:hypothetical protein [Emticicia sp.]
MRPGVSVTTAEPLIAGLRAAIPTTLAAPVSWLITYKRFIVLTPYNSPVTGRKSIAVITSLAIKPVIGVVAVAISEFMALIFNNCLPSVSAKNVTSGFTTLTVSLSHDETIMPKTIADAPKKSLNFFGYIFL